MERKTSDWTVPAGVSAVLAAGGAMPRTSTSISDVLTCELGTDRKPTLEYRRMASGGRGRFLQAFPDLVQECRGIDRLLEYGNHSRTFGLVSMLFDVV